MRWEADVEAIAFTQELLISRDQLRACGVSENTYKRRVRSGMWTEPHPGVIALGWSGSVSQRRGAALLAAGDEAALSHRAAAAIWGIDRAGAVLVELTTRRTRHT